MTLREIHPVQGHPRKKPEEMDWDPDQIKDGLHVRVALEQLALKQSIERLSDSEWRKHCEHL